VRPLIDVLGESRYFSIQAAPMELNDPPSASVLQKRR
jgi:hypothetical protein